MKRNGLLAVLLILSLVMFFSCAKEKTEAVAASNEESKGFEKMTIRYGSIYNEDTIYGKSLNKMKEIIENGSDGNIKVDIFHGGTLGSEQEHAQAQNAGSIEMLFSGTAGVGLYVPATAIFETWYSFEDIEQLGEAVNILWDVLDKEMRDNNFKLLGAYYDGPRNILSNVKITNLDELQNVKLRSPGANVYVNSISALGAQAIALPFGDVYTALQTNAIDAMEGTIDSIYQQKFYEQGKYLIKDSHVFQALFITYNLKAWNELSESAKQLIQNAVKESMDYQMSLYNDVMDEEIAAMKENGIEFVEITDRTKWVQAVKPATEAYVSNYGDVGKAIYKVVESFSK